jgi:hypothetical protein
MKDRLASLLLALAVVGCTSAGLDAPVAHFDPPSATTLPGVNSLVKVINLDSEPVVCFTTDGTMPDFSGGNCANKLDSSRQIAVPSCGFNLIRIAWSTGTDEANYKVVSDACTSSCAPVVPWSNQDLAHAFAVWTDEIKCMLNNCQNPSSTGSWSGQCDSGQVNWDVGLNGLRAISTFTYTACAHAVTIPVEENGMTAMQKINLIVTGQLIQDTDFSGNGNEGGTSMVSGDFTGSVTSSMVLSNKQRSSGSMDAACTAQPFSAMECAPASAAIAYDFPDWSCEGGICPVAAAGTCMMGNPTPPVNSTPNFVLIRFDIGNRCLTLATSSVQSTSVCEPTDPHQQWQIVPVGDAFEFHNLSTSECLSENGGAIGPWTLVTAPCDDTDKQHWKLEPYTQGGANMNFPDRLHNVAEDFCVYTDLTGLAYGTAGNCDLAGTESNRKIGIYPGGAFDKPPYMP